MENAVVKEKLREIGLTKNEVKVYITCLELGSSLASQISKKSEIYRTIIYDVLDSLIKKGLISYFIKENRKYFHSTSPESLIKYIEEKEKEIVKQKEDIESVIEHLKKLEKPKKEPYLIEVFSSKEGFKSLLEGILNEGKGYKMIGYEALGASLLKYYFVHWQKRRIKKKIKRKIIGKQKRRKEIQKYKQLTEARFLPNNYEIPTSVLMYGNKAILFLPLEDDFVGVRIESKKIVSSFETYFKFLWNVAKT